MAGLRVVLLLIIASAVIWSANATPKRHIVEFVRDAYLGVIKQSQENIIIDAFIDTNSDSLPDDIKQYIYLDKIVPDQTAEIHVLNSSEKYDGFVKVYFNRLNLSTTNGNLINELKNENQTPPDDDKIIDAFITKNILPDMRHKVRLVRDVNTPNKGRLVPLKKNSYEYIIGYVILQW